MSQFTAQDMYEVMSGRTELIESLADDAGGFASFEPVAANGDEVFAVFGATLSTPDLESSTDFRVTVHRRTNGIPGIEDAGPDAVTDEDVERYCEVMHDAYEKAAVGAGWETQEASRKPWAGVPEANKATMRAAVRALLEALAKDGNA